MARLRESLHVPYVDNRGERIHYETEGSGRPLVLHSRFEALPGLERGEVLARSDLVVPILRAFFEGVDGRYA